MPQAAKKESQRAQDKESKRARGALSCAECRRLKLKCDKTVPCSSCKRRGCSAICPNGSLITGQGTRFVLADTEALHQKIGQMSDRIRQLEDALAILQSTLTGPNGDPHPLLHRDLLKIKSSIDLHSASDAATEGKAARDGKEEEEGDAEQYIDAFGTLAIRDDGAATFYGRSAGSESLLIGEAASNPSTLYPSTPSSEPSPQPHHLSARSSFADFHASPSSEPHSYQSSDVYSRNMDAPLPMAITSLAASFPLAPSMSAGSSSMASPSSYSPVSQPHNQFSRTTPPRQTVTLQSLVSQYMPPYNEAVRLVQLYLEQAPWFFGAITQKQIEYELLPMWYEEAAAAIPPAATPPAGGLAPSATGSTEPPNSGPRTGTSHDLALLFIVFCYGSLTDINLPSPPDNVPAEKFYQLSKAALTLDPAAAAGNADNKISKNGILERPPSVATVQTLSLMAIYEGICSRENSIESTWALMGLACKLAQSIGLHRDCARWKLTPAEVQKRRALFWELFITDCWQSLATGRLATFSLPFVDCELPADPDQTIAADGSFQPSFPFWKARFGAECVSAVVQGTLTSRAPKYSIILDLDRKVRDMDLPQYAQGPPPQGVGLAQTMSHFMPQNYRELTLLYIHRCFFAHAISSNPLDPIKSQYAPSFLAGYRSACTILGSVKLQFTLFPAQISRFWVLWTHAFSASVMLASVATHSSRSKIAPAALLELRMACELFESAATYGGRAGKFLPILRRLQNKAQIAFREANTGLPTIIPNDIFKPSEPTDAKDELSIFSGKTHTVSTKVTPSGTTAKSSNTAASSPSAHSSSKSVRASSDSPKMITEYPSFANVHPSLVSELNSFHGHIHNQIQNAFRNGQDLFGGGSMVVDPMPRAGPSVRSKQSMPRLPQAQPQVPISQHAYQQQQQQQQQPQQQYPPQHIQQRPQEVYNQTQHEQQEMDRLRMEQMQREEAELRERQEWERQEAARQQQLEDQHEIQRQHEMMQAHQHQQQMEMQRQQEAREQQQRREQYLRDLEMQQQQQQQPSYQQTPYESPSVYSGHTDSSMSPPAPSTAQQQTQQPQHYRHPISHRQLPTSTQTMTAVPPLRHTQPPHPIRHSASNVSLRRAAHAAQYAQQQPPEMPPSQPPVPQHAPIYQGGQGDFSQHSSPEQMHAAVASSPVSYTPPGTSYGGQPSPMSAQQHQQQQQQQHPPAPYIEETYKYWPAASNSFAMPDQQPSHLYAGGVPMHHHYTPDGALRGIAAEDHSLQETWQSYMNKVGTPRQFLED
ncbi:hypothetical protein CPC08DRAFT_705725 [Agrocybe pediades]|nr:hypothetical protein CPC08DRAFT_705725 [Agrocybe pediades]